MSSDTAVSIFRHPLLKYSSLALVMLRTVSPIPVAEHVLQGLFPQSCWCIRSLGKISPIHDETSVLWQLCTCFHWGMYVLSGHYDLLCCTTDTLCQLKNKGDNWVRPYILFCLFRSTYKYTVYIHYWLVPAQDVHFFYTRSHLSALQNCALLFSTNFQFIFVFKKCITKFSHWIVSCTICFKNIVQVFINFTHSFVAIELLTFCKNAKKYLLIKRALTILVK